MDCLSAAETITILVCNLIQGLLITEDPMVTLVSSPLTCLNLATQNHYDMILVFCSPRTVTNFTAIAELCRCLKSNPATRNIPILAGLETWDRNLVETLCREGVDWIDRPIFKNKVNPMDYCKSLARHAARMESRKVLSRLCPYLNHTSIEDGIRMITCKAWKDRMVLGGHRLRDLCEAPAYQQCEYFLHPRCLS